MLPLYYVLLVMTIHSCFSDLQDPLSDAKDRAKELKAACSNVEVELLDAGHCPHDEVPHLVNRGLLDFMQKVSQSQSSEAQADSLESVSVL